MRYDRGRQSLDRHTTDIVATFIAGWSWRWLAEAIHQTTPWRPANPAGLSDREADVLTLIVPGAATPKWLAGC